MSRDINSPEFYTIFVPFYYYSIVSEIVDAALIEEQQSCTDVRSVFVSILQASDMDSRDKKAAIIDYIAAGIKTVRFHIITCIICNKKDFQVYIILYNSIINIQHHTIALVEKLKIFTFYARGG